MDISPEVPIGPVKVEPTAPPGFHFMICQNSLQSATSPPGGPGRAVFAEALDPAGRDDLAAEVALVEWAAKKCLLGGLELREGEGWR